MINIYFTHALFLLEESDLVLLGIIQLLLQIIIGPCHNSLQCFVAGNVRAHSQSSAVRLPSEITDCNTISSHFSRTNSLSGLFAPQALRSPKPIWAWFYQFKLVNWKCKAYNFSACHIPFVSIETNLQRDLLIRCLLPLGKSHKNDGSHLVFLEGWSEWRVCLPLSFILHCSGKDSFLLSIWMQHTHSNEKNS